MGTDLGFNVLVRPAMYDSFHDVEIYRGEKGAADAEPMRQTIVGNICESGDILAKDRLLPVMREGDVLGILGCRSLRLHHGFQLQSAPSPRRSADPE